jgi:transposase-like protein
VRQNKSPFKWRHFKPTIIKMSGTSYRLDENDVKVGTVWIYLYRAVDTAGNNRRVHAQR